MKKLLLSLLAIVLLFEEWLWDALTALGRRLVQWLHLARLERWLSQTSPNVALLAFAVPLAIVTPINLAALWLLTRGLILQGVAMEIFAKLLGTLMVARVFALTKPQLLTFGWIAWVYTTITAWLRWAHQRIRETAVYRLGHQLKERIKATVRAWRQGPGR
jgi:predicted ABC-type exoprotein transport system permease subunit